MKTWPLLLCTCLLLSHCREEQSTAPQQAEQLDTLRPAIFTTGIAAQCENRIRADLAALPREQELALDNAYYHQWAQTAQQWETILKKLKRHQHHQSAALQEILDSPETPWQPVIIETKPHAHARHLPPRRYGNSRPCRRTTVSRISSRRTCRATAAPAHLP